MNNGEFRGSGLDKMTGKKHNGSPIPGWYEEEQYEKIEDYVIQETQEFCKFYQWLHKELPELHLRFLN